MTEILSKHINRIAEDIGISYKQVALTAGLLKQGATIPFIARYRKELTGSLDEVQITSVRDLLHRFEELEKRRQTVLSSIEEQGKLTPELEHAISQVSTLSELEDLYLPFRPKRKTRATIAIAMGLEPLARKILTQGHDDPHKLAAGYINIENDVPGVEEALAGARDIIAEWINEDSRARGRLRRLMEREARIISKLAKGKEAMATKYATYFEWSELAGRAPSHRILAMLRGEKEGFLKVGIAPEPESAYAILDRLFYKGNGPCSEQVYVSIRDAWKRLMLPSLETEIRNVLKQLADKKAIAVFADNLRQLLLSPPLGQKRVLAIDPGFRTGCKLVCLDEEGRLLHNETIFPHPPASQKTQAMSKIQNLVSAYEIEAIAIGNGTAGRETEQLVRKMRFDKDIMAVMVNESGASVYSASDAARDEFPDYDVTVRGAISIGRRLTDPLAELVKIDPKAIGVGQYQHDVDQKMLKQSLDDVVTSCVNAVGVELNTASKQLLSYVSGIGPALAAAIADYRHHHGAFRSREDLKKVPRLGDKVFEQAAGFIRVGQSPNPLDRSAVHPESYGVVERMANDLGATIEQLIADKSLRERIDLQQYITDKTGLPTLKDILTELSKPGRDPRKGYDMFEFDKGVNSIEDLEEGMVLPGIVTNITAFGAFVDVGVHQDGLVHISHLADRFVKEPAEVVRLNQKVMVRVLAVDRERKRINLSIKEA